jgi:chaperone modulatory protein CbpM
MRDETAGFDPWLTLEQLSRALAVPPDWVAERVRAGLIDAAGDGPAAWRFDALVVRRVRSMHHTERCYGAVPELAALVADLEERIARLRERLDRLERLERLQDLQPPHRPAR